MACMRLSTSQVTQRIVSKSLIFYPCYNLICILHLLPSLTGGLMLSTIWLFTLHIDNRYFLLLLLLAIYRQPNLWLRGKYILVMIFIAYWQRREFSFWKPTSLMSVWAWWETIHLSYQMCCRLSLHHTAHPLVDEGSSDLKCNFAAVNIRNVRRFTTYPVAFPHSPLQLDAARLEPVPSRQQTQDLYVYNCTADLPSSWIFFCVMCNQPCVRADQKDLLIPPIQSGLCPLRFDLANLQ